MASKYCEKSVTILSLLIKAMPCSCISAYSNPNIRKEQSSLLHVLLLLWNGSLFRGTRYCSQCLPGSGLFLNMIFVEIKIIYMTAKCHDCFSFLLSRGPFQRRVDKSNPNDTKSIFSRSFWSLVKQAQMIAVAIANKAHAEMPLPPGTGIVHQPPTPPEKLRR